MPDICKIGLLKTRSHAVDTTHIRQVKELVLNSVQVTLSILTKAGVLNTPRSLIIIESAKAQICRTKAKPQQIVATRLLYCLQHPVLFKSSTKDSPPPIFHFNSWTSNTSLSANATKPTRYGSQPKPI